MNNRTRLAVEFPVDANGLIGRSCPTCAKYFKMKLSEQMWSKDCTCPHCGHKANHQYFFTPEQNRYMESVAENQVIKPVHQEMKKDFEVVGPDPRFEIEHYVERDLEKNNVCDACHMIFATEGDYSYCPDCGRSFKETGEIR